MPPKRKREDENYLADESDDDEAKEEDLDNLQEMKIDSDEEFDLHVNGLPALPDLQQEGDIAHLPDNGYGQFDMFHQMPNMEQMNGNFPAMPFNFNHPFDEMNDELDWNPPQGNQGNLILTPPEGFSDSEDGRTDNEDGQGVNQNEFFNPNPPNFNFQDNDAIWNMMNQPEFGFQFPDGSDSDMSNFATENESTSGSDWDGAGRIPRRFLNNYV